MTHPRPASLARRAFPALAVLGASGVLLTRLGGADHAGADLLTVDDAAARATVSTPPATAAPATTTTAPQRGRGERTTPPAEPGAPGAAPSTTVPAAPTPSPSPTGTCSGTTATGGSVTTRFGPVQVAAVIGADDRLCDVQVLVFPDGDRRSLSINQRALPVLRTQAIGSDGETISGVTGATVTTDAYRTSLQSALDAVR